MLPNWSTKKPQISIIVIAHNMRRELPRTLYSLSCKFQKNILEQDYEVIVVDNGSVDPLSESEIVSYGGNFRYTVITNAPPSPAFAVNTGVSMAKADKLALLVDGARILSPGFLHHALTAFNLYPRMVVATLGWHLGDVIQQKSVERGYDQQVEDELLKSINWKSNGYRLFDISTLALSSSGGCFMPIAESNALVLSRCHFERLDGYDVGFESPGGGLVNLDFYKRSIEDDEVRLVMLAGEGCFHQVHGGVSTNTGKKKHQERMKKWHVEYRKIRGEAFKVADNKQPIIFGAIPANAMSSIEQSIKLYQLCLGGNV